MTKEFAIALDKALKIYRQPNDGQHIDDLIDATLKNVAARLTAEDNGVKKEDVRDSIHYFLLDKGLIEKLNKDSFRTYKITPKGILFDEFEGFEKSLKSNFYLKTWTVVQGVSIAVGAVGLLFFEAWKIYHHLRWG